MSDMNLPPEALDPVDEDEEIVAEEESGDSHRRCACTLFAVVKPDGTLARGYRAVSATRLTTGQYEVIFDRNVRRCAYFATIGLAGHVGFSPPGEITVVGRFNNNQGVFVTTNDSNGSPGDRGFHLAVHCRP